MSGGNWMKLLCSSTNTVSMVILLCLIWVSIAAAAGKLNSQEKQELLDLHNYWRAVENAANMRRMVRQ